VVKQENYSTRWRKPHLRTPGYIFTKSGIIERVCGYYSNPETSAFKISSVPCPLYRVRFLQIDIWEHYPGFPTDTIDIEITHHWLSLHKEQETVNQHQYVKESSTIIHEHVHEGEHHKHEEKAQIEQKAIDAEGEENPYQYLAKKLVELILEKKSSFHLGNK